MQIIYIITCVALYPGILVTKAVGLDAVSDILIPVFVFLAFSYTLYQWRSNKQNGLMCLAFLFILIGDVSINLLSYKPGAVVFFMTHILLTILFLRLQPFQKSDLRLLPVFLLIALIYFLMVFPDLHFASIPHLVLLIGLVLYLSLLSVMVWRAVCLPKQYIVLVIGALLFYATDLVVLLNVIYIEKIFKIVTWLLYPPALFLLSFAVITPRVSGEG